MKTFLLTAVLLFSFQSFAAKLTGYCQFMDGTDELMESIEGADHIRYFNDISRGVKITVQMKEEGATCPTCWKINAVISDFKGINIMHVTGSDFIHVGTYTDLFDPKSEHNPVDFVCTYK